MAKSIPDAIIDLMLAEAQGTNIHICTTEPANYAAISGLELATASLTASPTQYTIGDGDTNGRKSTLAAQTGMIIHTTGLAEHVVISDGASVMYLVTTCTSQTLTASGTSPQTATVDTNAFDHEIGDAT